MVYSIRLLRKIKERLEILSLRTERTEIVSLQEGMSDMKETIETVMEKEKKLSVKHK